jgi:hypothetical protein
MSRLLVSERSRQSDYRCRRFRKRRRPLPIACVENVVNVFSECPRVRQTYYSCPRLRGLSLSTNHAIGLMPSPDAVGDAPEPPFNVFSVLTVSGLRLVDRSKRVFGIAATWLTPRFSHCVSEC